MRYYQIAAALLLATGSAAFAQSPEYMREYCANAVQGFYQDYDARVETKYEGTRVDGTHPVNGTIYLETRSETFQCSFNGAGDTLVDFYTEGQSWPDFTVGGNSPYQTASESSQAPVAAGDGAADVKFAPGTSGITLKGAIRGRDYFDYRLAANAGQAMSVDLRVDGTNGDGTIYFNILRESDEAALFVGSMDEDGWSAEVELPADDAYLIRLYLMGNDRDTDKTVGYDLDVAIR